MAFSLTMVYSCGFSAVRGDILKGLELGQKDDIREYSGLGARMWGAHMGKGTRGL